MEYKPGELDEIIAAYDKLVRGIDSKARIADSNGRAYGGIIRAGKGALVENIAKVLIKAAWKELGESENRLKLNPSPRNIKIPIRRNYIKQLRDEETRQFILKSISKYYYSAKVDIHIFVDDKFVVGAECKAYTENAMLKRILVDFTLLKSQFPNLDCVLFQLESQLGGDYSSRKPVHGSPSTHTLLSHFDIDLNIITLLEGERKVDKPIHAHTFFKPLEKRRLVEALEIFKNLLSKYA